MPLESGIVANLQSMPSDTVVRNRAGMIMNTHKGEPFAIVHQYDRGKRSIDPQVMAQHKFLAQENSVMELWPRLDLVEADLVQS